MSDTIFKPGILTIGNLDDDPSHGLRIALLLIALFVGTFHAGFLLTEYMQEDALITMRTSFNLADHGEYTFNLGEGYPGATSLLYGHYVALVRVVFGDFAILAVSVLNVAFAMSAAHLLAISLLPRHPADNGALRGSMYLMFFMAAGLAPAMMRAASSGMETPILIFCMALALFFVARRSPVPLAIVLGVLPFVRIDAIAFALIVCAVVALFRIRAAVIATIGLLIGISALLIANTVIFDAVMPLTAQAKELAYQPARDAASVLARATETYFTFSFYPGITSRYIGIIIYSALGVVFFLTLVRAAWKYVPLGFTALSKHRQQMRTKIIDFDWAARQTVEGPRLIMALSALLVPAAYVYGGVLFVWYLWPFSVMAYLVLADTVFSRFSPGFKSFAGIAVVLSVAGALNIVTHVNIGAQESGFRAFIGTDIKSRAAKEDTLFLEPAGYIPFFADIESWDTIGLASPRVLPYRADVENLNWWVDVVQGENPTFILERQPIHTGGHVDGKYVLTDDERAWFNQRYELLAHYVYDEYLDINRGLFTPILRLGSHSDYYLYRVRP